MSLGRLASVGTGALLLSALAACGSSAAVPTGDGGSGGDTGVLPNADGGADSDTGSPQSSDGGSDTGAVVSPDGGDGGACQLPAQGPAPNCFMSFPPMSATIVMTSCMSGMPPQAQGGTIPEGIYDLVVRTEYGSTCPMVPTESATLLICDNQWDWVIIYSPDGGVGSGTTYLFNYAAAPGAGGTIALTSQCESDVGHMNLMYGYTYYSSGQLDLIESSSVVATYAKR